MASHTTSTAARQLSSTTSRTLSRVITTSRSSTVVAARSSTSIARPPVTSSSTSAALTRTTSRPALPATRLPPPSTSPSDSPEEASATPPAAKSTSHTGVIAAVVAIIVFFCLIGALVLWRRRSAAARKEKRNLLARRSDAWNGGVFDSPSVLSAKSPVVEKDDGHPEQFPWRPEYPFAPTPYSASNMSINSTAPLIQEYPNSPAAPSYREEPSNPYEPTSYIPPYAFPATPVQDRPPSPAYPPGPPFAPSSGLAYVPRAAAEQDRTVAPLKVSGRMRQDSLGLPEQEELGDRPTSDISERAFDSFPKPPTLMRQDSSMARPMSASSQDSSMARPVSFGEARPVSLAAPDDFPSPQGFPQTPTTAHPSNSGHSNESPLPSAAGTFHIPVLPFAASTSGFSPDSTAPNTPAVSRKPSDASVRGRQRSVTPSLPPLEPHSKDRGSWNFLGDWDR